MAYQPQRQTPVHQVAPSQQTTANPAVPGSEAAAMSTNNNLPAQQQQQTVQPPAPVEITEDDIKQLKEMFPAKSNDDIGLDALYVLFVLYFFCLRVPCFLLLITLNIFNISWF